MGEAANESLFPSDAYSEVHIYLQEIAWNSRQRPKTASRRWDSWSRLDIILHRRVDGPLLVCLDRWQKALPYWRSLISRRGFFFFFFFFLFECRRVLLLMRSICIEELRHWKLGWSHVHGFLCVGWMGCVVPHIYPPMRRWKKVSRVSFGSSGGAEKMKKISVSWRGLPRSKWPQPFRDGKGFSNLSKIIKKDIFWKR